MKPALLDLLCCPDCGRDLALIAATTTPDDAAEIESGSLACANCARLYPVINGVPRFVRSDGYVGSFSFQWTRWNDVQVDRANGDRESEETFALKTGLTPADVAGRCVLDVGCGAGRFLDVASRWGGEVVGVDYSFAADACRRTFGHRPGVNVVQADVFHLPFKPGAFDVVYSIGVLHHTRDTRAAFLALPPLLKPGGQLAVWLYYYTDALYRRSTDFWRGLIAPLPHRWILAWCWLVCALFSGLYRRAFMQRTPWSLLPRLLPVGVHPKWRWRVLDTFDWYSPAYQDKECDPLRVAEWCRKGRVRDVEFLPFPTSVRATRDPGERLPLLRGLPDFRRKRFVVFGAGAGGGVALEALATIGLGHQVVGVVDNDPAKAGRVAHGLPVQTFAQLARDSYDHIVIGSLAGGPAIAEQLERTGQVPSRDFFTIPFLTEHQAELQLASHT